MSNDDTFRGGPRRPGGGFRPRGDGPRPSRPAGPASEGDRPRKPFFRDGAGPSGPRRDFGAGPGGPRRDFGAGPGGPRRDGDAPRGPRRDFGDAPKRDFGAGPGGPRREGGDAPRRSFAGPRDFRRDGDAPRGPRRDFGAGPGGPRREGGDAPRRSFDGPRDFRRDGDAPRGPRRDFGDAPKRDFSAGPGGPRREGGDAPRRSFDGPRGPRRDGDAPRGPRRDFGDAPRRSFDAPRDFHRTAETPRAPYQHSDAPRRAFFKAESEDQNLVAALQADAELPLVPATSPAVDPGNDDWEVPLGNDEPNDGSSHQDADQMVEADVDAPAQGLTSLEDPAMSAQPLTAPDHHPTAEFDRPALRSPRPREDNRRDGDRFDNRGQDQRGFDADARRAQRQRELRIHGLNACLAVVRDRRDAVRKVYLRGDRAEAFEPLLEWCRNQHLAYRYVTDSELSALTSSEHHEGICLEIERKPWLAFESLLNQLKLDGGNKVLLLLDGVGNPHNIGGILRAAAHFGVHALLLPPDSTLQLSAATYRTAEGGAELVPIVKLRELARDLEALSALDFHVIGSFPREATSIYTTRWPDRTVLVIGAEQNGIRPGTAEFCDRRFTIPGSGAVESLNAATATAVLLSAYAGSLARETWAASKS